jgi:hypothetical protein
MAQPWISPSMRRMMPATFAITMLTL